jgi:hypothetical protein
MAATALVARTTRLASLPVSQMAQWPDARTLHEIAATAFFVHEHGEQTAERYVLHEAIESWRAACDYHRHARAVKVRPYKSTEMNAFEAARTQLLERFGKSLMATTGGHHIF